MFVSMNKRMCLLYCLWFSYFLCACSDAATMPPEQAQPTEPQVAVRPTFYGYEVVHTYPHDPTAFTQGLVYLEGFLYEGTGLNGRSSLRKVVLESGEVIQQHDLSTRFFGEGIAVFNNRVLQLTWRSQTAFVYDLDTFEVRTQFSYPTEGWGLTHDGQKLIISDGTSTLYFRDPFTFAETGRVTVYQGEKPVTNLNELEYIDGQVFANVWQRDYIVRIDPQSGQVTGIIDLKGLLSEADRGGRRVDVLNGIAYDSAGDRLFVTGKLWPKLYEINLVTNQNP